MRFSLLQLARLRGWEQITINLIEQAIADTRDCMLDFEAEWDIDFHWLEEYMSLRPALDQLMLDQFGVSSREVEGRDPEEPLTAVQRKAAPHLRSYLETMSGVLKAVQDSNANERFQSLAVRETQGLLARVQQWD